VLKTINKMLKIGINGFGRIGRAIFRVNNKQKAFEIVAINDVNQDNNNLAYMLKYDSTYGILNEDIKADDGNILLNGNKIKVYHKDRIDQVPWEEKDVDIVVDSSGVEDNVLRARRLIDKNIRCVVTHAPNEREVDKAIIVGVNEDTLTKDDYIISNSICDANAFSPVMNVLNKNFEIDHGFLTTLHPWLSYQHLLDGPSKSYAYPGEIHDHYVLGRASPFSLIPKPTSCIDASCKILDFLKGKFLSLSFRVPTAIVSTADISVKLNKKVTKEEIVNLFKKEQENQKFKIFYNNTEPLVSTDFVGSDYSAIIDHRWTMVNESNYLKMILWYDNEWGYSSRAVDLIKEIEKL